MNNHINTMTEVEEFFNYLANTIGTFHPDDDLVYDELNQMMEEAFLTCKANGKDIYEIALNTNQFWIEKGGEQ